MVGENMRKVIASIDIGSNTIKMVVAEFMKSKMFVLGTAEIESVGVEKGFVVDKEKFTEQIKNLRQKCEDMIGLAIRKVIVSVPTNYAGFLISEGFSSITNQEGIVKSMDIIRTMQGTVYNKISNKTEIVAIIPMHFKINGDQLIANPIGMPASKLYLKAVLVTVPQSNVLPILKCFESIGMEVIDITISGVADYHAVRTNDLDMKIGALINIGHETTTVSIFNKGILTNTSVLAIGGKNIEQDFSYLYKVTSKEAKKIKEEFALANKRLASASNKYNIKIDEEAVSLNQYEVSEVAHLRIEEILKMVKKEINLLTKKEIHYIIVTGGTSEISDFNIEIENAFSHKAILHRMKEIGVRDNKYSVSVGMLKYYNDKMKLRDKDYSILTIEEQEELSGIGKKLNISENSVLGKLFGYFFDN